MSIVGQEQSRVDVSSPLHVKARKDKGVGYPDRQLVSDEQVSWDVKWEDYNPPYYVAEPVIANDRLVKTGGWADPEKFADYQELVKEKPRVSYEGLIRLDENGYPLNPKGRTGLRGRGLLGNWGPNNAADPIVTYVDKDGYLRLAGIKRGDAEKRGVPDERALPGGMVDAGERVTQALGRELTEETSAKLDFAEADVVYQGYVDDPRNTDNAWMETDAYHLHIDNPPELIPADDADDAGWFVVDQDFLDKMYASHAELVKKAIGQWQIKSGKTVGSDGRVLG